MYIDLSKILPLLVLPVGIAIELCLLALLYIWKDRGRVAGFFLSCAVLVLWLASMPMVGHTLLGRLEREYPALEMRDIRYSHCMIVLGGAVEPVAPPRMDVELNEAADRVRKAAQLYHAGKARVIIVSGGKQPWSPYADGEAQAIRTVLLEWGVPQGAIVLEDLSRNTRENAFNTTEMLQHMDCKKPLLITSAAHMRRAVGAFGVLGVTVFPVAVDIRVIRNQDVIWLDFLPDAEALKMTTDAIREWLGQMVYKLKGWN